MQRIVIDTNVIISSLIQNSYPYTIVNELFIDDKIEMCVSDELLAEYYEVLRRKKFARFHDFFHELRHYLLQLKTRHLFLSRK
ncbi:putative toxin-antitoxin system toxin component, PIN family [Flavobacterium sp.]|uniref:putative toxin-antitoxin system toxin component, PIN family n=1 Tax=Flavobacterium sp. TaxID=239 RepID=UPI00375364A1